MAEATNQVTRLEQIFLSRMRPPKGKECPAMDGLVEEGKEVRRKLSEGHLNRKAA